LAALRARRLPQGKKPAYKPNRDYRKSPDAEGRKYGVDFGEKSMTKTETSLREERGYGKDGEKKYGGYEYKGKKEYGGYERKEERGGYQESKWSKEYKGKGEYRNEKRPDYKNDYKNDYKTNDLSKSTRFEPKDYGQRTPRNFESTSRPKYNYGADSKPDQLSKSYNDFKPKSYQPQNQKPQHTQKSPSPYSRRTLTKHSQISKSQTLIPRAQTPPPHEAKKPQTPKLVSSRSQITLSKSKQLTAAEYVPSKKLVRRGINRHNYGYGGPAPPSKPQGGFQANAKENSSPHDRKPAKWQKGPKMTAGHTFGYGGEKKPMERNFGRELKENKNNERIVETPDNRPAFTRVQYPPFKHNRIVRTQLRNQTNERSSLEAREKEKSKIFGKEEKSSGRKSYKKSESGLRDQSPSFGFGWRREEEDSGLFGRSSEKFRQTFGAEESSRTPKRNRGWNKHQYGYDEKEAKLEFSGIKARDELAGMSSIKEVEWSREMLSKRGEDRLGKMLEDTPRTACVLVVQQKTSQQRQKLNTTFQRKSSNKTEKTINSSQIYFSNFSFQQQEKKFCPIEAAKDQNISETFETAKPRKNIFASPAQQRSKLRTVSKKTVFQLFCNESNFRTCKFMNKKKLIGICDDETEGHLKTNMINWRSKKVLIRRRFNCSKFCKFIKI
jgi:hypothetical protein